MGKNLMICSNSASALHLNEGAEGKQERYILQGDFAELGKQNRNGRIYTKEEYLKHLAYLREDIRKEGLLGELDHPDDRFEVKLKDASHKILDIWYDKDTNTIQGKIELLNTPNGKLAQSLVDQGIPLHISSRAAGSVNSDNTVSIQQIYTYDLVAKPGFASAVLHRVNESESTNKYTEDVNAFLGESNKMESMNAAGQYGFINEDVSITEVASDINLRKEAKEIQSDMNNTKKIDEEDVMTATPQQNEADDAQKAADTSAGINEDDDKDEKKEDEKEEVEEKEDLVEIKSVEPVFADGEEEDAEIKDVEAEYDGEDEKKDDEDEKEDDKEEDDEEDKNESEETVECDGADCKDSEKKDEENNKPEEKTNQLFDCNIEERKHNFEDKLDALMKSIETAKKKNECAVKSSNESVITRFPASSTFNESNFAAFLSLNESQKTNVIDYLRDNNITSANEINEAWKNGIDYNSSEPVWMKYAPENYRKLYESASENVKNSIKMTAEYLIFENQADVNTFWNNTGLMESSARRIANDEFINSMPKIVAVNESEELPYGNDFISAVTRMACEYNPD